MPETVIPAFPNCVRYCPRHNDADHGGCPGWWETIRTNPEGEQKIVKSCYLQQLPEYLIEVIRASNRPAAAVESCRNVIADGFVGVMRRIHEVTNQLPNPGAKGHVLTGSSYTISGSDTGSAADRGGE